MHDVGAWLRAAVDAYGGDLPVRVGTSGWRPACKPNVEPTTAHPAPSDAAAEAEPAIVQSPEAQSSGSQSPEAQSPVAPMPSALSPEDALDELRTRVLPCTKCKLAATRTHVVFGEGNPRAPVLFIGEAPGSDEDQQGRPFVGRSGQLLDKIIEAAMGYARGDVFIANVNKCRPPENRAPEPDEVAACLPFLRAQVRIIRPGVIVCLGRVASSNLLGTSLPMRDLRGRELEYEGIPVVVTWHPAYLLRTPSAKGETWADIRRVNRLLGRPEVPLRRDGS